MALERTQMAWVRTGVSLIGFGFTIYQVLGKLPQRERAVHPYAARDLGLALIGTGIVAMLMAAMDYRSAISRLSTTCGAQSSSRLRAAATRQGAILACSRSR